MSLEVNVGKRGNILEVGPENAAQVCHDRLLNLYPGNYSLFYLNPVLDKTLLCFGIIL